MVFLNSTLRMRTPPIGAVCGSNAVYSPSAWEPVAKRCRYGKITKPTITLGVGPMRTVFILSPPEGFRVRRTHHA